MASTSTALQLVLKTLGNFYGIYTTMYLSRPSLRIITYQTVISPLGVGAYTPFGLATSYKEDAITRFAAIQSGTEKYLHKPNRCSGSLFLMFFRGRRCELYTFLDVALASLVFGCRRYR